METRKLDIWSALFLLLRVLHSNLRVRQYKTELESIIYLQKRKLILISLALPLDPFILLLHPGVGDD